MKKKKKILFLLNTYSFQSNYLNKNISLEKNYSRIDKININWMNFFYKRLKKHFILKKDYPYLNKAYLENDYISYLEKKIDKFKPNIIFSTVHDQHVNELLANYKKIKKIVWISFKTNKQYLESIKNSYQYLITDNDLIYYFSKSLKYKCFNLKISAPKYINLKKKDFEKRSEKIYFTGSLGENFNYRFQVLNFLNNNFKLKIKIRNLYEKFKILNYINSKLLKIFPKFTQKLYMNKILPLTNSLKYVNENEIFGKQMLDELKQHKFCINIHSDFGKDKSINMRVYEALSCGCLLITDRNLKMEKYFKDRKHVIYFTDQNDLKNKLLYYIKNREKSFEIAKKGNEIFLNQFCSEVRFKEFLNILKKIDLNKNLINIF